MIKRFSEINESANSDDVEIDSGSKEQVAIRILDLLKNIVGEKYIRNINED